MQTALDSVEAALADLRRGKMVIVVDDADRENEGDLVMAAEHATPAAINFMAKFGRGLICVPTTGDRLKQLGRSESSLHRKVFRPWGWYDSVDAGERFQVKRIVVKPGGMLSLQMHHHRAEHWIVVSGTARVTRDGETFLLSENQSTFIPLGIQHRLENPGQVQLEMIEVQSGSYLGEDDIVRFDDVYGR